MTDKETQALAGVASELNAELDSLLEMANDYLSAQKENRLAPCNPDFLIKHLAINAKRLIDVPLYGHPVPANVAGFRFRRGVGQWTYIDHRAPDSFELEHCEIQWLLCERL